MSRVRIATVLFVFLSLSLVSTGCSNVLSCIMNSVMEEKLAGPFVSQPTLADMDRESDAVTSGTSMVYFFWTHPDTEEGQSYECQIVPVNAPPLPAETPIGSAAGNVEAGSIGGEIAFTAPPGGWVPGTYRADILLAGEVFDSVEFTVAE